MATFKVLTFGNINELDQSYVDSILLSKGIYLTKVPSLFNDKMTIEQLINNHKYVLQLKEEDEWIKNIKQCKLTEIQLILL